MTTKTIEVRDRATFIPMLAVRLDPATPQDAYLLSRAGYGTGKNPANYVMLIRINNGNCEAKLYPHEWGRGRTVGTAHLWVAAHFDEIESGAVVDVEYILCETPEPKKSESELPTYDAGD